MLNTKRMMFLRRFPPVTIVVIPHGPQRVLEKSFKPTTVRRALGSAVLSIAAIVFFTMSYIKMGRNMVELKQLRAINAAQEARIADLSREAEDTRARLERVSRLEAEIRELLQKEGIVITEGDGENPKPDDSTGPGAGLVMAGVISGLLGNTQQGTASMEKLDALQREFDELARDADAAEQRMEVLKDHTAELVSYLRAKPDVWPTSGTLTSRFGYRTPPSRYASRYHEGIDIGAPYGSPIYAAGDGVVKFAGWKGGLGRLVIVDHSYGIQTYYGHASRVYVKVGQHVKKGQVIAAVGTSGIATGPHLHYQVVVNGRDVDPLKYLPYGR